MATIKKKDLKKYKPTKKKTKDLEELVDADGSPIEGDRGVANDSEIETAPQQTSADFAQAAIQPNRWYNYFTGTPYSHGNRGLAEEEELTEAAKNKMRKMVEDMLGNKSNNNDLATKTHDTDVNRNKIPDSQELKKTNPLAEQLVDNFMKTILKTQITGDDKAMVLNYIIENLDMTDISSDYKRILKSKI